MKQFEKTGLSLEFYTSREREKDELLPWDFIDAGISDGPYCEPGYPTVNEAKRRFSELSSLNIYFSTIDEGLTTVNEPEGDPDWGHYDALCELELGRIFAKHGLCA